MNRLTDAPDPPPYLSSLARPEWDRLAPLVLSVGVAEVDVRALVLLAETLADETALREEIRKTGPVVMAGNGGQKAHPALAALNAARATARGLLAQFGLTPADRARLPPPPPATPRNIFDED